MLRSCTLPRAATPGFASQRQARRQQAVRAQAQPTQEKEQVDKVGRPGLPARAAGPGGARSKSWA